MAQIILPNNTVDNPSIWDTNLDYEYQSMMAKIYTQSVFDTIIPTLEMENIRPVKQTYDDTDNNIQIEINTVYCYPVNNKAALMILKQFVTLQNI